MVPDEEAVRPLFRYHKEFLGPPLLYQLHMSSSKEQLPGLGQPVSAIEMSSTATAVPGFPEVTPSNTTLLFLLSADIGGNSVAAEYQRPFAVSFTLPYHKVPSLFGANIRLTCRLSVVVPVM